MPNAPRKCLSGRQCVLLCPHNAQPSKRLHRQIVYAHADSPTHPVLTWPGLAGTRDRGHSIFHPVFVSTLLVSTSTIWHP